jgi:carbonic anhydrase
MKIRTLSALSLLFVCTKTSIATNPSFVSADEALVRLKSGNLRFISAPQTSIDTTQARVSSTRSQEPIAAVVTCSDSRTAPEFILNKNLNRIFVVRTAGNVVDDVALGSVEYAVNHLGVRLVVVMGHENCGAVSAALQGGHVPAHIDSIVKLIIPSVKKTSSSPPSQRLHDCITENARNMASKIAKSGHFSPGIGELKFVPAVYNFQTGKVDWIEN